MNDDERVFDALIEEIEDDEADNVRQHVDEREDTALAVSVQAIGFQVPVILTAGKTKRYRPVEGFRRLRAAKRLKRRSIPAIFRAQPLSDGERLHLQIAINERRQRLLPLEKSRGIAGLMEAMNWKPAEASRKLGMSPASVSRALALLKAPPEVQQAIDAGRVAGSTANDILAEKDPTMQLQLVRDAASGPLTREAVAAKRRQPARLPEPTSPSADRVVVSLTVALADRTFESFISSVQAVLAAASQAQADGQTLQAYLKNLRQRAKGKSS